MYRAKRLANGDEREPLRALPSSTQSTGPAPDPTKEKEVAQGRKIIGKKLTRKMLQLVQSILLQQKQAPTHPEVAAQLAFPTLPGAYLRPTNPALEFVKTVCHVFGLARELGVEVQVLKRNLLDLVGVKEFADLAIFKNPCEVLKLPSVICTQCQSSRDLDLCRDPERLPQLVEVEVSGGGDVEDEEEGGGRTTQWVLNPPRNNAWLCPQGHLLDATAIEIRLVDYVQRLTLQYQLQDVDPFLYSFLVSSSRRPVSLFSSR